MKRSSRHRVWMWVVGTAATVGAGTTAVWSVGAADGTWAPADRSAERIIPSERYTPEMVGPSAVDSFADRRAQGIPQFREADGVLRVFPRAVDDREESLDTTEDTRAPSATLAGTAPTLGLNFVGARVEDSGYIPPDTMGAIGPNHFMETLNGNVSIYRKSDGFRLSSESLDSFFSGSGVSGVGDPRILFDHHSGRWIVLVTNFSTRIGLAVSTSSDATGSFFKTNFLAATGSDSGTWVDYPTLGVDENGIYTGAYMVGRARMTNWAIDKAPLIAPTPSLGTVTAWRDLEWSLGNQPAHTYGTPGSEYIIGKSTSSSLRIYRVDPPLTSPTMVDTGTVSVGSFSQPPDAPALGSGVNIDTVGDRLMMSVYRGGSLWTTHCVGVSGRAAARWYEINPVSRTVIQSGTVADGSLHYYFPSLMVNGLGDVAMGISGSNSGQYVACYYTGRRGTDPAGDMATPQLLKAGEAAYQLLDGYGRNRWGDYSYTTLDPSDDSTFWTVQEYAETPDLYSSAWGTWIGAMSFGCSSDPECNDSNDCTTDACVGGTCQNTPLPDDTPCSGGICCGGTCTTLVCTFDSDCDDVDLCTTDTCTSGGTCSAACSNDPIDCDDSDACTTDSCDPGSGCVNDPIDCDDSEPCTTDTCDSVTGCDNAWPACGAADGCCGPACTPASDPDCTTCGDGTCAGLPAEDCNSCPADCIGASGGTCGDGICSGSANGEDCFTCSDCRCSGGPTCRNGCCGDGSCSGNENAGNCPVDCDPGFVPPAGYCCGDGTCEGAEDPTNCPVDCGGPCVLDSDCDPGEICCGGTCIVAVCDVDADCDDADACTTDTCLNPGTCSASCDNAGPACGPSDGCCPAGCTFSADPDCPCGQRNDPCNVDGDCCSGDCKNNGRCR